MAAWLEWAAAFLQSPRRLASARSEPRGTEGARGSGAWRCKARAYAGVAGRFSIELFQRYQRSELVLAATLAEMYVQGVPTRKAKATLRSCAAMPPGPRRIATHARRRLDCRGPIANVGLRAITGRPTIYAESQIMARSRRTSATRWRAALRLMSAVRGGYCSCPIEDVVDDLTGDLSRAKSG